MDEFMKQALEIGKAQAGVRAMTTEQFMEFVQKLASNLRMASEGISACSEDGETDPAVNAKKSIKERSVVCLECGKTFKMLSKKHLESHGLTAKEYKEKYGLKKDTALACKELVRKRRNKMKEMALWTRKPAAKHKKEEK